jgi:hypothetical protein
MNRSVLFSFLLILSSFFLFSCTAEHEQWVEQSEELSYLRFTGNPSGIRVQIDDQTRFQPDTGGTVYEVEPGTKEVKVFKNGELKIHRKIFLSGGDTRELNLP